MNICFYTSSEVSPTQGGTERITDTVARNLTRIYGCNCFSLYSAKADVGSASDVFVDTAMVRDVRRNTAQLAGLLRKWKIDVLINQGSFSNSAVFSEALHGIGAKQVFCHHFEPGWEAKTTNLRYLLRTFRKQPSVKGFMKVCLFPCLAVRYRYLLCREYAVAYRTADRVVLLSKRFIPQFLEYGHIREGGKISVIHNSLSFDSFYDAERLEAKEKTVLIVSRMAETQKRISLALKIWNAVESRGMFKDWTLRIVGAGEDLPRYRRYAKRHKLRQVVFEGVQPPEDFYRRASIFMMTSKSEGWGLTLTEAQQNGCVPLAFDTYGSLHEIMTDGHDGFIIPEGDMDAYVCRLEELMRNETLRTTMAANAIGSSRRFGQEVIAGQWHGLLAEVMAARQKPHIASLYI